MRQPPQPAIQAPSGTPSATATVPPPVTMASARPRSAGDTIAAATALAVGRNTPATSPSATRARASCAMPCAIEAAAVRPAKVARLAMSSGRRPKRASSAAISGEPIA
ncbi:hypothetical protein D9M68_541640 [compost metagenome]